MFFWTLLPGTWPQHPAAPQQCSPANITHALLCLGLGFADWSLGLCGFEGVCFKVCGLEFRVIWV